MYTEEDIYTPEDIIAGIIVILVVLAWFGFGIWLSHRTPSIRVWNKDCSCYRFHKRVHSLFVLLWTILCAG